MKIYKNTISDTLWEILLELMDFEELKSFRLVGGTNLSLILGHRISVDIDMFSDAEYGSIDFESIDKKLLKSFDYVDNGIGNNISFGKSYFIGKDISDAVKVDLFYTDKFVFPIVKHKNLRLSSIEEIAAMKLEIIGNNGRKKDFWDIHELLKHFSWKKLICFYLKRYPYGHTSEELITKLTDFNEAESDLNPICLKNKYWEIIKLDIEESVKKEF